mmetsp:Transcript_36071/g.75898  ORF Transcript_36071/g.75898 Transcript_36071/m.75898 type:complete len:133 (+) Transcript_36071:569-967(+)
MLIALCAKTPRSSKKNGILQGSRSYGSRREQRPVFPAGTDQAHASTCALPSCAAPSWTCFSPPGRAARLHRHSKRQRALRPKRVALPKAALDRTHSTTAESRARVQLVATAGSNALQIGCAETHQQSRGDVA